MVGAHSSLLSHVEALLEHVWTAKSTYLCADEAIRTKTLGHRSTSFARDKGSETELLSLSQLVSEVFDGFGVRLKDALTFPELVLHQFDKILLPHELFAGLFEFLLRLVDGLLQ